MSDYLVDFTKILSLFVQISSQDERAQQVANFIALETERAIVSGLLI